MSTPVRDDPSIGLLRSITADALDPDYEVAARRERSALAEGGDADGHHRVTGLILLLVVALLLIGGTLGLRQGRGGTDTQSQQLRERVSAEVAATDAKNARAQALRNELSGLTSAARAGDASDDLRGLEAVTGSAAVSGPGVRVVLSDAPTSAGDKLARDPQLGKVLDVDVQHAVNGLWAAGAEAVSVNGQRLTSLTAIRSAGEAILVNYRPLSPPYVIEAIGDPRTMEARFVDGPAGQSLEAAASGYGLGVDISTQDRLSLPAASTSLRSVETSKAQEDAR